MTTPVVAPRSGLNPPARHQSPPKKKNDVIPEFSFRDSGMKMSGISAARRGLPLELRLCCREATARGGTLPLTTFKKTKTPQSYPRAVHSRGGTAPNDHSCGQHVTPTLEQPSKKKTTSSFRNLPRLRVGTPMGKQAPPGILSHTLQRPSACFRSMWLRTTKLPPAWPCQSPSTNPTIPQTPPASRPAAGDGGANCGGAGVFEGGVS